MICETAPLSPIPSCEVVPGEKSNPAVSPKGCGAASHTDGVAGHQGQCVRRLADHVADRPLLPTTPFPLDGRTVILVRRGSEAHGTHVPPEDPLGIDDRDLLGVVVPPPPYYLGLKTWEHAEAIQGPWDVVLYEVRKFIRMLMQQNPNVLAALWARPEDFLELNEIGARLVDMKMLFRAKQPAYNAFVGYAHGQLKRTTHFSFQGYMGAKRKTLVEKFGYDTKNAAHLVRLLRMGVEFIKTGHLRVFRDGDREELISIKKGAWELQRVREEADRLFAECRDALPASPLPESIDADAVERMLVPELRRWMLRDGAAESERRPWLTP